MEKRIKFSASIQAMAVGDVESALGVHALNAIRNDYKDPFFVKLILAHEGISKSRLVDKKGGKKSVSKHWAPDVIQKLADAYIPANREAPAQMIVHHDNVNDGNRPGVGAVQHSQTRVKAGKIYAEAIGHVTDADAIDKIKSGVYDTCSIEADIEMRRNSNNSIEVTDVLAGTAVAIGGTGEGFIPAFEDAGFVAQVQCAADDLPDNNSRGNKHMDITVDEIITEIISGRVDINRIIELPKIQESIKALQAEDVKKIQKLQTDLDAANKDVSKLQESEKTLTERVTEYEGTHAFDIYHGDLKTEIVKMVAKENTPESVVDQMVAYFKENEFMPKGDTPEAKAEDLRAQVTNLQKLMSIDKPTTNPDSKSNADPQTPDAGDSTVPVPKDQVQTTSGPIPNPKLALNTGDKGSDGGGDKKDSAESASTA